MQKCCGFSVHFLNIFHAVKFFLSLYFGFFFHIQPDEITSNCCMRKNNLLLLNNKKKKNQNNFNSNLEHFFQRKCHLIDKTKRSRM